MKTLKLRDDFYWAGIVDDTLRVFDIIMYTEFGTTYNSYVLKSGGKTVLFETVKEAFFEEWMDKLGEVIDVTKIDYLVVNHTEPDHAGSVQRLLKLSPQLKIISTACAAGFLKEIVNSEFCNLIVHDNETMKIGDKTLRFLLVPNLHWPDTMYTFIEEEQVLVTCDSFGSHYGFQDVLVSKVTDREGYMRATKYYFDCIIGPFKPFMLKALERVRELDVSMICPGHGPVLDSGIDFIEETYERWCTVVNPNKKKTVVIPYVSAYGYTKQIAEKIEEGIKASGDIDVRSYDMVTADQAKVLEEIGFADGWNTDDRWGSIKADLGSDNIHFCGNTWRETGKCIRQLRLERRRRAAYHGASETASHEYSGRTSHPFPSGRYGACRGFRIRLSFRFSSAG